MAIIYVSTTGNDSTGDGSQETPYLTVAKGITMATAGDTISVGTGTYTETITINKSLTLTPTSGVKGDAKISSTANTLTISHSTNNVIIDKMEIISSGTSHNAITVSKQQSFTLNASGLPVLESLCDNIQITNCNIIYAKYGFAFNGKNSIISNNVLTQNVAVPQIHYF
jgi:nitrous oxidase accessory protein NosD